VHNHCVYYTISFESNKSPLHLIVNEGTNNTVYFLHFLLYLLSSRELVADDYLILDNAKIHSTSFIFTVVCIFCSAASVHMYFIPFYSPEMNLTELVYAFCKYTIRQNREEESLLKCIMNVRNISSMDLV
jgi:transposase